MTSSTLTTSTEPEATRKELALRSEGRINKLLAAALIWSTAFTGLSFSLGGFTFNPERVLLLAFSLPLFWSVFKFLHFFGRGRYTNSILIYMLFLLVAAISTAASDDAVQLLPGLALYTVPVLVCLFFANLTGCARLIEQHSLAVMTYLSLGGITVFFLGVVLGLPAFSGFIGSTSNASSVKLTVLEPNIFGLTLAFLFLLNVHKINESMLTRLIFVFGLIAIFLSFSRGPFIAFALGIFVYSFMTGRFKKPRFIVGVIFSVAVVMAVFLLLSDSVVGVYDEFINRGNTIAVRLLIYGQALEAFLANPFIGHGALSFAMFNEYIAQVVGATSLDNISISQIFVSILHDTGAIGLALYLLFLGSILAFGYKRFIFSGKDVDAARLSAFICVLVASQTTTVHYTTLFGIAVGILANKYANGSPSQG